jgi:hydrogenase maturation factor
MKKYTPHLGQASLVEACGQPGCPICSISKKLIHTYLQMVLAAYVDHGHRPGKMIQTPLSVAGDFSYGFERKGYALSTVPCGYHSGNLIRSQPCFIQDRIPNFHGRCFEVGT